MALSKAASEGGKCCEEKTGCDMGRGRAAASAWWGKTFPRRHASRGPSDRDREAEPSRPSGVRRLSSRLRCPGGPRWGQPREDAGGYGAHAC